MHNGNLRDYLVKNPDLSWTVKFSFALGTKEEGEDRRRQEGTGREKGMPEIGGKQEGIGGKDGRGWRDGRKERKLHLNQVSRNRQRHPIPSWTESTCPPPGLEEHECFDRQVLSYQNLRFRN
jgi:hypothetical protein